MVYLIGNTIEDIDFNTFIGVPGGGANKALVAFSSGASATNKVAAIYGVGFGDRGYGQTARSLVNVVAGTGNVLSTDWTELRESIADVATHQGTLVGDLPIPAEFLVGEIIEAHSGLNPTDFAAIISDIDTNRLNTDGGLSLNTVASGAVSTRVSSWSSTINATFTATFTTSDAARYFFNSGGSLTVVGAQPGATAQDIEWARIFSTEVGTYEFRANDSFRSGSGGIIQFAGYYGLSTTPTTYYDGTNIGSGVYAPNDVFIQLSYTGATTNGAKGNVVTVTVILQDQHGGVEDIVSAGTTVTVGHRYAGAASILAGVEQPTWAITDNL